MLLAVLAHVDADHGSVVIEEKTGERLGELGLTDAGRSEKKERASRTVRISDPGTRSAHRVADCAYGCLLPDHPTAEVVLHAQQLGALAFE